MCMPKKPNLAPQRREAEKQEALEQDRRATDKRKRLAQRRSGIDAERFSSLASFTGYGGLDSVRSFFSPTGGAT